MIYDKTNLLSRNQSGGVQVNVSAQQAASVSSEERVAFKVVFQFTFSGSRGYFPLSHYYLNFFFLVSYSLTDFCPPNISHRKLYDYKDSAKIIEDN